MNNKTAILSGRYEIPHPGHIKTIIREAQRFKKLYVYIVDNPKNPYPVDWAREMLHLAVKDWACYMGCCINICLDKRHFGRVTAEDLEDLPPFDVFLSSNPDVTAHLRGLGVNVEEIERTPGYSDTEIRERIKDVYRPTPR